MCQCLLIQCTRTLDDFSEGVENLTGNSYSFKKVGFTCEVNQLFAGVVPVEVHNGFLEPKQVIDGADDDVHSRGISGLGT